MGGGEGRRAAAQTAHHMLSTQVKERGGGHQGVEAVHRSSVASQSNQCAHHVCMGHQELLVLDGAQGSGPHEEGRRDALQLMASEDMKHLPGTLVAARASAVTIAGRNETSAQHGHTRLKDAQTMARCRWWWCQYRVHKKRARTGKGVRGGEVKERRGE